MKKEIRIMLVENDEEFREDLTYLINREDGFSVTAELERGEDAVCQIKKIMPDVVLMDLDLSGQMDGIEATKRIKDIE